MDSDDGRQKAAAGSILQENKEHDQDENHDHFHVTHPDTNWKSCVEHAEKIGIGSREYELIEI